MSDAWLNVCPYCQLCTGSAGLLRRLRNAPFSNPRLSSKRAETLKVRRQTKTLDSRHHHRDPIRPNRYASNPHSSVQTTQRDQLRPRGFLP